MIKHLGLLIFFIVLLLGCQSGLQNQEQPPTINSIPTSKLDSIKSVVTIIMNTGNELTDTRSSIESGIYKTDEEYIIRSISFSVENLLIDSVNQQLLIDMVNLESYDSTEHSSLHIDSSFFLTQVSHLALSNITIGEITNEILLPLQMVQDSSKTYVEAKTTLTLNDWGFDLSEGHKLHLGFSLYTLSEK